MTKPPEAGIGSKPGVSDGGGGVQQWGVSVKRRCWVYVDIVEEFPSESFTPCTLRVTGVRGRPPVGADLGQSKKDVTSACLSSRAD